MKKDLRDLMSMIDESQNDFDENASYFDGVWDRFDKLKGQTVPDAVVPMSDEMIKFYHKRKRSIAANLKSVQKEVLGEVNVYDNNSDTFMDYTGPGRPSSKDAPNP